MKFYATLLFVCIALGASAKNDGYIIDISLKPLKTGYIYLGCVYGKQLRLTDSARLNEMSEARFSGASKKSPGIYFIARAHSKPQFYFLLDKDQQFAIRADTISGSKPVFTGSRANSIFTDYQDSIKSQHAKIDGVVRRGVSNNADTGIRAEIKHINAQMLQYRQSLINKYPDAYLSEILRAMLNPEIPQSADASDSLSAVRYLKLHYWDEVRFYENRLIRTPFFEPKLDNYFDQLVATSADSINKEIDWMMGFASGNTEMETYMIQYFINRYLKPKRALEDSIYLHLYDKHLSGKNYPWLTYQMKEKFSSRAFSIMANAKGKPAFDINLPDRNGKKTNLYSVQATYTLLVFWDPTCTHCRHLLPVVDSMYQAKWKRQGLKIFSTATETDGGHSDWLSYLDEERLSEWTNVYCSKAENQSRRAQGLQGCSQSYDVIAYPELFLLDEDKHIVAKKINYLEVDALLEKLIKVKSGGL